MALETISLNGDDWEAQYFISRPQFNFWMGDGRNLANALLDSPLSSEFIFGKPCPGAMKGRIPGCDRSFLLENGQIPDPFFGRNLERSDWSERAAWGFRKTFVVPESWRGRRILLNFDGIDYSAFFFLNNEYLGDHTGAFLPVTWDITDFVKFGQDNLIVLEFFPAPQGEGNHRYDRPADFAYFHRTQIGFGWDWIRKFVPTGIWKDVSLISYDRVRLRQWNIRAAGTRVSLELELHSRFAESGLEAEVTLTSPDGRDVVRERRTLELLPGTNRPTIDFDFPGLRHWRPNGTGRATLYTLRLELAGDPALEKAVGFKDLKVGLNEDAPEDALPLLFHIDGTPVPIHGVNWVPPSIMPSQVTEADYEHLVAMAANAGVNLFRVWGGGQLEKECFYDLCDRYGIMVWHEFYHACSSTPKNDPQYLTFKEREARSVLRQLRHHVSLAMICGGNELQTYGESPDSPVLAMYRRVAGELVPELPFQLTCPDNSRPGDRYHGPWTFQNHDFYNRHFRYLASEFGCNAMPPFDSLKKFVPENELECRESQVLQYHFMNVGRLRKAYSFDNATAPFQLENMRQFCHATMLAQADVMQYVNEHYRRLFPRSSGCLFWQYNESWPTCAWSIVDFYGRPKAAVYSLKQATQGVLLSMEDDGWCVKDGVFRGAWHCSVREDMASGRTVTAQLELWTASGRRLWGREASLSLVAGTQKLLDVEERVPGGEVLVLRMTIPGLTRGTRLYGSGDFKSFFTRPNAVRLVQKSADEWQVVNDGRNCALAVRLEELDGAPEERGFFSDDYLTLLPGESRTVRFIRK